MTNIISIVLGAITACGVLLTGIGTYRNNRHINEVHDAVRTANGDTVGQIIEKISSEQDRTNED